MHQQDHSSKKKSEGVALHMEWKKKSACNCNACFVLCMWNTFILADYKNNKYNSNNKSTKYNQTIHHQYSAYRPGPPEKK